MDAVITTSAGYPLDLTFYQSVKGITAASQIVRQGGRILLFGACDEGAGAAEFSEMLLPYPSAREFLKAIEGVPVTIDQWQIEKLAIAALKADLFYCVPGLPSPYIEEKLVGLRASAIPARLSARSSQDFPEAAAWRLSLKDRTCSQAPRQV